MKEIMTTLPKKDNPCYECTERKLGCHSKCEKYKIFRIKIEEMRNKEKLFTRNTSSRADQIHDAYTISKKHRKTVMKVLQKVKF